MTNSPKSHQAATTPTPIGTHAISSNLEAEELYVSALLADSFTLPMTRDYVHWQEFAAPRARAVVHAAWDCTEQTPPMDLTRATLTDRLQALGYMPGTVTSSYLRKLDDLATPDVIKAARQHAALIRKHYRIREIHTHTTSLAASVLNHPDETDLLVNDTIIKMQTTLSTTALSTNPADIDTLLDTEDEEILTPAKRTGLAWFDLFTRGGFRAGHMTAIQGRYKGRKTTFTRSLCLRPMTQGDGVSWFTLDGTKHEVKNGFLAMIATHHMWKLGVPQEQWFIDSFGIPKALRTAEQHEAIEYAKTVLRGFPLRIYDGRDMIKDVNVLESILRKDTLLHGTTVFVADYVQKFHTGSNKVTGFDNFEQVVDRFSTLTTGLGVSSIVLAQRNEGSNKSESDEVAGTKYGGALAAAADHFMETWKEEERDDLIGVRMKFSRYAGSSSMVPTEMLYRVNPSSGLILNMSDERP